MKDHAREKDTAAWLAQEYGGSNSLFVVRAGSPEETQLPWPKEMCIRDRWEYRLGEIERGQLAPEEFLDGISTMLGDLVGTYQVIKGTEYLFTPPHEVVLSLIHI